MVTLGVREIRASYTVLVDTLKQEGEVVLTHHGKPFARVLPLQESDQIEKPKVRSMTSLLAKQTLQTISSEAILAELRQARS